jgi:hypothetical protein
LGRARRNSPEERKVTLELLSTLDDVGELLAQCSYAFGPERQEGRARFVIHPPIVEVGRVRGTIGVLRYDPLRDPPDLVGPLVPLDGSQGVWRRVDLDESFDRGLTQLVTLPLPLLRLGLLIALRFDCPPQEIRLCGERIAGLGIGCWHGVPPPR